LIVEPAPIDPLAVGVIGTVAALPESATGGEALNVNVTGNDPFAVIAVGADVAEPMAFAPVMEHDAGLPLQTGC